MMPGKERQKLKDSIRGRERETEGKQCVKE